MADSWALYDGMDGKEMFVLIYIIVVIEVYLEEASPSHPSSSSRVLAGSAYHHFSSALSPVID
jgi:hypothetical protein